jgi:hypothetical protein
MFDQIYISCMVTVRLLRRNLRLGGVEKNLGGVLFFCERSEPKNLFEPPLGGVKTLIYFPH